MSPTSRYRNLSDLPVELPLFPLRGAILLPRTGLPLNVFEPRYLTMLDAVIESNRLLGIIQPKSFDGEGAEESPQDPAAPMKPVGCTGRVTGFQELEDGRLAINLTGVARFRIGNEVNLDQPFRTFEVDHTEFEADLQADNDEELTDRAELLKILQPYFEARRLKADWQAFNNAPAELLINSLSTICPFGPEEKQALLEAPDLNSRADVLAKLVVMELASDDRSGSSVQ
ncbi:MAG: LON peptidase substrate-binding domain-containing protein [Pseudomonadota bacterium]